MELSYQIVFALIWLGLTIVIFKVVYGKNKKKEDTSKDDLFYLYHSTSETQKPEKDELIECFRHGAEALQRVENIADEAVTGYYYVVCDNQIIWRSTDNENEKENT